jgi:uncharacterized membrane protein
MPDFESKITVSAPKQAVFAFVSEVANLPKYLPTVKHAEVAEGQDHIRVTSEVQGESRTQDGFFRQATPGERLEWGSDGDKDYHGAMDIKDADANQSTVTVYLHLNPPPQDAQDIEQRSGQDFEQKMQEGVERCLQSIKNAVEGTGGKSEIPESR